MRVNAFLEARGSNGQVRTLGGRSRNDGIAVDLNSDNATQFDCCMRVDLDVIGEKTRKTDTRKSVFRVVLPKQTDENCVIYIDGDLKRVLVNGKPIRQRRAKNPVAI